MALPATAMKTAPAYSDFTPAEQKQISAKVAKLVKEGKPQAQAVAIAIKMLFPDRSTSEKSQAVNVPESVLRVPASTKRSPAIAGRYHAEQAADGTWTVFDVPVFSEHTRKVRSGIDEENKEVKVDEAWLRASLARAQEREAQDGYLAPIHVRHHPSDRVENAGLLRPTEVRQMAYDGAEVWTLFADFLQVPAAIYERIKALALPYRSVEVHALESPEIGSLALLDTEVPYFRYPLLAIASESKSEYHVDVFHAAPTTATGYGLVATAAVGNAYSCLYRETIDMKVKASAKTEPAAKTDQTEPKPQSTATYEEAKPEAKPAEEKKEPEVKAAAEPTLADVLAVCQECLACCKQMLAAESEETAAAEAKEEEPGAAPAHGTPVNASALQAGETAALKGRLKLAEDKVAAIEREAAEEKAVAAARKQLASYAVAADIETDLREAFRLGGSKHLNAVVASIKKYAVEEPGEAPPEGDTDAAALSKLPAALKKYADMGPDALKDALTYAAEYEGPGGQASGLSLEKYVDGRFTSAKMLNGAAPRK